MILKNQFAELIYPKVYNLDSIYESIETAARISYKSESKGDSKKFVENLIKSGHYSPLEFGTVYLYADCTNCDDLDMLRDKYYNNVYSRSRSYFNYPCEYITTNMRVLQENGWLDDLKYLCTSSTFHKKRYTLHCVTSIGVTRELNRHRNSSIIEQSTRYCNYSKDKFGSGLTCIIPTWFVDSDYQLEYWKMLKTAEKNYFELLKYGLKPQDARDVLPLATATEAMYCMYEEDLKHLLDLRVLGTTGAPHPQVKELLTPIYEELKDRLYRN